MYSIVKGSVIYWVPLCVLSEDDTIFCITLFLGSNVLLYHSYYKSPIFCMLWNLSKYV